MRQCLQNWSMAVGHHVVAIEFSRDQTVVTWFQPHGAGGVVEERIGNYDRTELEQSLNVLSNHHSAIKQQQDELFANPLETVIEAVVLEGFIQAFERSLITAAKNVYTELIQPVLNANRLAINQLQPRLLGIYCNDFRIFSLPLHCVLQIPVYYIVPVDTRISKPDQHGQDGVVIGLKESQSLVEEVRCAREELTVSGIFNNHCVATTPHDLHNGINNFKNFHYIGRICCGNQNAGYALTLGSGTPYRPATQLALELCFLSCSESLLGGDHSIGVAFVKCGARAVVGSYWLISEADQPLLVEQFYAQIVNQARDIESLCIALHEARRAAMNRNPRFPTPQGQWRWDVSQCLVGVPCQEPQDTGQTCQNAS